MSRFEGTQRYATPGNPQIMQRKVEDEPGSSIVRRMAEAAKGRDYGDVRDLLNSYSSVLTQNRTLPAAANPNKGHRRSRSRERVRGGYSRQARS